MICVQLYFTCCLLLWQITSSSALTTCTYNSKNVTYTMPTVAICSLLGLQNEQLSLHPSPVHACFTYCSLVSLSLGGFSQCCQLRGFPAQLGGFSDSLGGQFLAVAGCGFFGQFRNLPRVLGYLGFGRELMVSWYS